MSEIEGSERHIEGSNRHIEGRSTLPPCRCGMREALSELFALVNGECPSLLSEDSGGNVHLAMKIDDLLAPNICETIADSQRGTT